MLLINSCNDGYFGSQCELKMDCRDLEERVNELPEFSQKFEKSCSKFNPKFDCRTQEINFLVKFILDLFIKYKFYKCNGKVEMNVENTTFILTITNVITFFVSSSPFLFMLVKKIFIIIKNRAGPKLFLDV